MKKRKPTRRDLLIIVGRLQDLIGDAVAANGDRNINREEDLQNIFKRAHKLCVEVRSYDKPIEKNLGPWGEIDEVFRARKL